VRFFPRRSLDRVDRARTLPPRALARRRSPSRPSSSCRGVDRLALALVNDGAKAARARRSGKDYWRKNLRLGATRRIRASSRSSSISAAPEESWLASDGATRCQRHDVALTRSSAVTPGLHFEKLEWTLNGAKVEPEDRAGLKVFTPRTPLAKDERSSSSASASKALPRRDLEERRGADEFVLPSASC
jgi:hypothetical protein